MEAKRSGSHKDGPALQDSRQNQKHQSCSLGACLPPWSRATSLPQPEPELGHSQKPVRHAGSPCPLWRTGPPHARCSRAAVLKAFPCGGFSENSWKQIAIPTAMTSISNFKPQVRSNAPVLRQLHCQQHVCPVRLNEMEVLH